MATMFGIPVDEKDKEKEKDKAADDGNIHSRTANTDADADIDLELMHDAAVEVDDGHDDELICVYDKENPARNALDGHNWMYPVAIGLFQSEAEASWTWLMMQLKRSIGLVSPLAVHTDACKGLENAVKNVFTHAEKRE
ncbi:hypothetical protein QYE76_001690 [Lolium multiflorum]|uniref:MULE transposase domain-containing protein n=1 Tax=Lolium multiflorum TaxID=4521 RepID=A0AAD8VX68_LOLMU|nr:hypothetical protein QYE76_001690 [Lolium multiflorum]